MTRGAAEKAEGDMTRYELRALGDELAFVRQPDGKVPLRAQGFLKFGKAHTNTMLMCEVRNGEILIWIEEAKRTPDGKNPLRPA